MKLFATDEDENDKISGTEDNNDNTKSIYESTNIELPNLIEYIPYKEDKYNNSDYLINKPYINGPYMDVNYVKYINNEYMRRKESVKIIRKRMKIKSNNVYHQDNSYDKRFQNIIVKMKRFIRIYLFDIIPNFISSKNIYQAIYDGDIVQVAALINRRTPINSKDNNGQYPISIAIQQKHHLIIKYLLTHDVIINVQDDFTNFSPLHHAIIMGNKSTIRELISFNIKKTYKDSEGMSALHWACIKGYLDIVGLLLSDKNVNINDIDVYGWTPLHIVCFRGYSDIFDFLFSTGKQIKVNAKDIFGYTPMMYAEIENNYEIFNKLKEKAAKKHLKK